jgi:hypothetical protein
MDLELIIHIGPHKTGTTYIQHILKNNFNLLMKKNIYYMYSLNLSRVYNKSLWLSKLKNIKKKYLILSSENFCKKIFNGDDKNLNFIISISKILNRKLIFVYYIRPQVDWINSVYCQIVSTYKNFNNIDNLNNFNNFSQKLALGKTNFKTLNLIDKFKNYLNRDEFIIKFIPFSKRDNTIKKFFNELNLNSKINLKLNIKSKNVSLGTKGIWISILIKEILNRINFKNIKLKKICCISIKESWFEDKYWGFNIKNYNNINSLFKISNEKFSKLIWNKNWDYFFDNNKIIKKKNYFKGPKNFYKKKYYWSIIYKYFKYNLNFNEKKLEECKNEYNNLITNFKNI